MAPANPAALPTASIVVYAKHGQTLAGFYAAVLGLTTQAQDDHVVVLGGPAFELVVVQAPPDLCAQIHITAPPQVRTDTPIKPSFAVAGIERLRDAVLAAGGGLQPLTQAWAWRGALHLDGWDPEGNVFQLRQPDA